MNRQQSILAAHGLTDRNDRLITADDVLAELQQSCGGRLPGTLAVPELLALVRQSRTVKLRLAREFAAFDGEELVSGFVRIHPLSDEEGGGCEMLIENWHRAPQLNLASDESTQWIDAIDRAAAEITARLDARQVVQWLTADVADATDLVEAFKHAPGKVWTEYVELGDISHEQPLHWRLLDGAQVKIPGSDRAWRARLMPIETSSASPSGFELFLIANQPLGASQGTSDPDDNGIEHSHLIGSALTPVLRQPIARIVANAETIRSRLAGPLRDEYSEYAGNIAAAGQHLSAMLDDLADLEVVEAPDFATDKERVDIADVAKRAAGILGVRAQSREITLGIEIIDEPSIAIAEFRRVLQIMINLISNAIAYSPEGSSVTIRVSSGHKGTVRTSVIDQGPGIDEAQSEKVFEKFERLGRDSDGGSDTGSGLGLFISRKLAHAMDGDLEIVQPGPSDELTGAEFRLILPAAGPL